MGTIIKENEIENLKMKVIGLKNEISQEMWDEFCQWMINEVEYVYKYKVLGSEIEKAEDKINDLEREITSADTKIKELKNKLTKYDKIKDIISNEE